MHPPTIWFKAPEGYGRALYYFLELLDPRPFGTPNKHFYRLCLWRGNQQNNPRWTADPLDGMVSQENISTVNERLEIIKPKLDSFGYIRLNNAEVAMLVLAADPEPTW